MSLLCVGVKTDYTWEQVSPLDDYVHREDGYYNYTFVAVWNCDGYTLHVLNMTSQKWMDETVTTTPIWWHHLYIAIPKTPRHFTDFHLFIGDGEHGDPWPTSCDSDSRLTYLGDFVRNTGAVAANIRQVPYQPLFFTDTPNVPRTEDMIIARSWRYYIEEIVDDPDVVLPVPMVKAAKKAVDTVIEYSAKVNPALQLTRVMPSGRSKRGWTTWLLAATDKRVFAMVPIVLTVGNWHENLMHHYRSYGAWSWAMSPYYAENITQYINNPRTYEAFEWVGIDYMIYNQRYSMPKLVVHSTGDEFFLNDDPWYFFTKLQSPKFVLTIENAEHVLGSQQPKVDRMSMDFFEAALAVERGEFTWPVVSWARSESVDDGTIGVFTNPTPLSVTAWWADTTNRTCDEETGICRRDFRLTTAVPRGPNPITWVEIAVTGSGNSYQVTLPKPADGVYRGFFLALTFAGSRPGDVLYVTTELNILPNVLPYNACTSPEECTGTIV